LLADGWNVQAGWRFYPVPDERPVLEREQRLVMRISAPADAVTLNAILVFEDIGAPA
jgi:hypothetical protein